MPINARIVARELDGLPPSMLETVRSQIRSESFSGRLRGLEEAPVEVIEAALVPLARDFAQAPVSGFFVGAVALGVSGAYYLGANMEFTGVPLSASLHAEQSAVLNAWIHGESAIRGLAVSEAPCGHCRQFLRELAGGETLSLRIKGQPTTLAALLPLAFGDTPRRGEGLLDRPPRKLESSHRLESSLQRRALNAAQRGYAPYTGAPEGFALEGTNGKIFVGRSAESVAFNPSVTALVCALNARNMSASRDVSINACAHARLATSLSSQTGFSRDLLRSISGSEIQQVVLEPA